MVDRTSTLGGVSTFAYLYTFHECYCGKIDFNVTNVPFLPFQYYCCCPHIPPGPFSSFSSLAKLSLTTPSQSSELSNGYPRTVVVNKFSFEILSFCSSSWSTSQFASTVLPCRKRAPGVRSQRMKWGTRVSVDGGWR